MLENIGYTVHPNGYHDHCDLIINNVLRIEIKGALWTSHRHSPGRWQFNTRNHPDVYILRCLTVPGADFIIPGREIGDRTNIAIWSQDPTKYHGRWAKYCNRWDIIEGELKRKASYENPD